VVGAFIEENFPRVFGLRLAEASLSSLVKSDRVRPLLLEAEQAMRAAKYPKAIEAAARSFKLAMREHDRESKLARPALRYPSLWRLTGVDELDSKLEDALRGMSEDFGQQITILAHHLDYNGYLYLKTFGPVVHGSVSGRMLVEWMHDPSKLGEDIAGNCVAFAIDAALRLEGGLGRAP
jgi:hypothetical protein